MHARATSTAHHQPRRAPTRVSAKTPAPTFPDLAPADLHSLLPSHERPSRFANAAGGFRLVLLGDLPDNEVVTHLCAFSPFAIPGDFYRDRLRLRGI